MPKCPSVSNSGWLGPCSENNSNDPELIPMPQAWLASSGHHLLPSPLPLNLAPGPPTRSLPYAFCLLSQPYLALVLLTLTLALSHDPKSFPVRSRASSSQHGPGSTLQGACELLTSSPATHKARCIRHSRRACGDCMNPPPLLGKVVWGANFVRGPPTSWF